MRFLRHFGGRGLVSAAALLADDDGGKDDVAAAAAALGAAAGAREAERDRAASDEDEPGKVIVDTGTGGGNADDAPTPPAAADDDDDGKKPADEEDEDAKAKAARAEGHKAGTDRCLTVMQSEHFAGREPLAAELLGTDMAADKIVGALAKATKAGGNAMLDALAGNGNPNLGAGNDGSGGKASIKASWDRALTETGSVKK